LNGSLYLRVGKRDHGSALLESRCAYPLHVLQPQRDPRDGSLSLTVLMLAGGLLDGDELQTDVVVEPGARLALRTQAATQAHAGHSCQRLRATIGAGGWLTYVPHSLVPHAAASHHASTQIWLEAGAELFLADALAPGRLHRGEAFAYDEVRLDLDIQVAGRLAARERTRIRPADGLNAVRFGPSTHTGSVYVIGSRPPRTDLPQALSGCATQIAQTELAHGGWYVRMLATSAAAVHDALAAMQHSWVSLPCTE